LSASLDQHVCEAKLGVAEQQSLGAGLNTYGVIGFGRIGQHIAGRLQGPDAPRLVAALVRPSQVDRARLTFGEEKICTSLDAFVSRHPAIAVECASATALDIYGPPLLAAGIDLVPLSLAALADPAVEARLCHAASVGPGRIELAAGAMASLDFLAVAREDALSQVTFRASYPTARWIGTPAERFIDLARVTAPTVFFRGAVREAASLFPRHLNVSVGVALAGLGLDNTAAELLADPSLSQAAFAVEAVSRAGAIRLCIGPSDAAAGVDPLDYTTFSVIRVLRRRTARIAI
jgi:aspartate dehydrogenase